LRGFFPDVFAILGDKMGVEEVLKVAGIVLAVGSICGVLAKKINIPDIVVFLLVGMLLGPAVGGVINVPASSALNQLILLFGSCYILFDGGASVRLSVLKQTAITLVVIATVGVVITGVITGYTVFYLFADYGVPLIIAMLLGFTLASTDPAALVPIFKQVPIKDRVAQTVMSESAFNDAMGAIAVFTILNIALGAGEFSAGAAVFSLLKESAIGIAIGGALGYLALVLIAHEKYDFLREHLPLVTLMAVIAAYLGAIGAHGSGYMAVFVFGIMLGNRETFGFKLEHSEEHGMEDFILTTALIMRMFIFILLGSQVDFGLLNQYAVAGGITIAVFMLIARPLTVFICAGPDRRAKWSMNELLFMCWTRETGVIPAALAGILAAKLVGTQYEQFSPIITSVTFLAILFTILLQATSTPWLARKLGLLLEQQKS
jgi:potassium/hydrogen antiporter